MRGSNVARCVHHLSTEPEMIHHQKPQLPVTITIYHTYYLYLFKMSNNVLTLHGWRFAISLFSSFSIYTIYYIYYGLSVMLFFDTQHIR